MSLTIRVTNDRDRWVNFIDTHTVTTFMQSWAWGDFEESCGHRVVRYEVLDEDTVVAVVQAFVLKSRRGTMLYVPHGPILHRDVLPWSAYDDPSWCETHPDAVERIKMILDKVLDTLKDAGKTHECVCVRFNSSLPDYRPFASHLESLGYRQAPLYLTSENAAVLSLEVPDLDTLRASMRKTTRYLIHKAMKDEVTIEADSSTGAVDHFMKLYHETTQRERFVGFSPHYIQKEFEAFGRDGNAYILHARHKASYLASALIIFTNSAAFYHQGASSHSKIPAPYLLQWEAIKMAHARGCKYYNFWGTYIQGRTPRSWQGLTLFKTGFTKRIWKYVPTYDLPLRPWYVATQAYESLVRLSRGV